MQYVEACNKSLHQMIIALGGKSLETFVFSETLKAFEDYKNAGNADEIKRRIGLNDNSFDDFLKALRKLKKENTKPQNERAIQIASLRLLDWFGRISRKLPELKPTAILVANDLATTKGEKQVRAAELVIRSLMSEKFGDQNNLINFIREYYAKDTKSLQDIEDKAAPGDILSGTDFSQLVSLFLKPDEFQKNYSPLYDTTPFLKYLDKQRETLRFFLDDIRRIRNDVAHRKPLTLTQIELLNIYYEEIMTPIQDAHDQGKLKVNPDQHLKIDDIEIKKYIDNLKEDLGSINDGIIHISADVGWIRHHIKWIIAGLTALAMLLLLATYLIQQVRQTTHSIQDETATIAAAATKEQRAIEQDPTTIGLINLKLDESAETSTSKVIWISATVYLNIKGSSFKDVQVNAIVEKTSLPNKTIDISALLAQSNAGDVQVVQFDVPADSKHIYVCMTANHPSLHQPYTAIWSYALGVTRGIQSLTKDRPAQMRQGSAESCL
jgi:hypothetical protein